MQYAVCSFYYSGVFILTSDSVLQFSDQVEFVSPVWMYHLLLGITGAPFKSQAHPGEIKAPSLTVDHYKLPAAGSMPPCSSSST